MIGMGETTPPGIEIISERERMDSVEKFLSAGIWDASRNPGGYRLPQFEDSAKDLKSYLVVLGRNRLIILAGKYKVKVSKTGRKKQIIDTFLCRVPSDMIETICLELEREEAERLLARRSRRRKPISVSPCLE
jgi:hypothetical protein